MSVNTSTNKANIILAIQAINSKLVDLDLLNKKELLALYKEELHKQTKEVIEQDTKEYNEMREEKIPTKQELKQQAKEEKELQAKEEAKVISEKVKDEDFKASVGHKVETETKLKEAKVNDTNSGYELYTSTFRYYFLNYSEDSSIREQLNNLSIYATNRGTKFLLPFITSLNSGMKPYFLDTKFYSNNKDFTKALNESATRSYNLSKENIKEIVKSIRIITKILSTEDTIRKVIDSENSSDIEVLIANEQLSNLNTVISNKKIKNAYGTSYESITKLQDTINAYMSKCTEKALKAHYTV